ncbi:MAG: malto-oligosyltrehalose synthase [Pirellulaceae bacterium]|nr:malto-oligosyltrehalose synthase [Pirellulaceae bacterium]
MSLPVEIADTTLRLLAERQRPRGSTYRLQFNAGFKFRDAAEIVPYLHALGVTHVYSSPYLTSQPGSPHGYDVCNHEQLNPELGTAEDYVAFVTALETHGLGQILDVVPNHMAASNSNGWWLDLLENGVSSPYAHFFDIDWRPIKDELAGKVLLPILGQQYGDALEAGELKLEHGEGAFTLRYFDQVLPIAPKSAMPILEAPLEELKTALGEASEAFGEYQSILTALAHLPPKSTTDPAAVQERQREKEVIKRRLKRLESDHPLVLEAVQRVVTNWNGAPGDTKSFDPLDKLLEAQAYRLSHWKAASDEVNYRRFFDINSLAALCMEHYDVFERAHRLVLELAARGDVDGFRIDHIDGLLDPLQYLWRLQWAYLAEVSRQIFVKRVAEDAGSNALAEAVPSSPTWEEVRPQVLDLLQQKLGLPQPDPALLPVSGSPPPDVAGDSPPPRDMNPRQSSSRPLYVVVEKILGSDEPLPADWPIAGTSGYDFLHQLGGLFVETEGLAATKQTYFRFIGERPEYAETVYRCKLLILRFAMASELQMLAHQLNRISEQHRRSRDFTLNMLRHALREVLASFPVYRTYVSPAGISDRDQRFIHNAIGHSKRRSPAIDAAVYDFIRGTLLLQHPEGLEEHSRRERELFTGRFQQVTSPVMAKGVEDTAYYVYCPLISANEVGSHPEAAVISPEQFHRENLHRREQWPASMLGTSTHDTKRSEDVRARIAVLAEIPGLWRKRVNARSRLNRRFRSDVDGLPAPSKNDEYLLYQSLVGVWPLGTVSRHEHDELVRRVQAYMEKATHEAKVRTSWVNPNGPYDHAVRDFVGKILEPRKDNRFLADFRHFHESIVDAGLYTSLSQLTLKLMSPGVPDIYQGQELWDLSLVDPDNRRPVDYAPRKWLLGELTATLAAGPQRQLELARELARNPRDSRLKLFVTSQLLKFRRDQPALFSSGTYQPLEIVGPKAKHLCAFAWRSERLSAVVIVPRLIASLGIERTPGVDPPVLSAHAWAETAVNLDSTFTGRWKDVLTGEAVEIGGALSASQVLGSLSVAVLQSVNA